MMMLRILSIFLLLLATPSFAQDPILAYDVSSNDYQCTPGQLRTCYVPAPNVWGPVNPSVGGPDVTHAFAQFNLPVANWVEITFDVSFFLFSGGAYVPGIGIDGYDDLHLCPQFQGGLTNDNPAPMNISLHSSAICLIQLQAGDHKIYAMEYARPNSFPFRGIGNHALIVRFY